MGVGICHQACLPEFSTWRKERTSSLKLFFGLHRRAQHPNPHTQRNVKNIQTSKRRTQQDVVLTGEPPTQESESGRVKV